MATPAAQGSLFELDHGFAPDAWPAIDSLQRQIEWFQRLQDEMYSRHLPAMDTIILHRQHLAATLAHVTDLDEAGIADLVTVLTDGLVRSENTKLDVSFDDDSNSDIININDEGRSLVRHGLISISAEEQYLLEQELAAEYLSTHSLPAPDSMERPNDHGRRDRYFNILGEFFKYQEQFIGITIKDKFTSVHALAQFFFLRAILTGYNTVAGFHETLAVYFPRLKPLDWRLMKRLVRERVDVTLEVHGRYVTEYHTALDETDPQALIADLYTQVPGIMALAGEMEQLYCDVVRATKPIINHVELPDLVRPDLRLDGFKAYHQRIFNCYRVTMNKHMVAKSFGVAKGDMAIYLADGILPRRRGRGRPRGSPNRKVVPE